MKQTRLVLATTAAALALVAIEMASAQVPPHKPGTICFTPRFWCWANPPGPPGLACYCPTPQGLVRGTLG